MTSRHAFGSRLRTQRERRGITLESIVDSTKIKQSLLTQLERGDASQWPRGLFRRAYIRDYACAIGLPAEPLVAEFVRLFPEDGSLVSDDSLEFAQEPMRLSFAVEPDTRLRRLAAQAASVLGEFVGVIVAGGIVSFGTGWTLLEACGTVALVYYPVATALTGRGFSAVHLRSILKVHPAGMAVPTAAADAAEPAPLYIVARQPSSGTAASPASATASAPVSAPLVVSVTADEFPQPRTAAR